MAKRPTAVVLSLLALLTTGVAWAQKAALSNQDVIDLVSMGLSNDVIIAKIQTATETNFDTSVDALRSLKEAKVPDAVIGAMIKPKPPAKPEPVKIPGFLDTYTIAYKFPDGSFIPLEQAAPSSQKTKGMGKAIVVPGAIPKVVEVYRGAEASVSIAERRPTFYVRTYSAKGFFFVRLDKRKDHRELEVSGGNAFNLTMGVNEKDRIDAVVGQVGNGVFSALPVTDLVDGEYLIAFDEYGAMACDFGIISSPKK